MRGIILVPNTQFHAIRSLTSDRIAIVIAWYWLERNDRFLLHISLSLKRKRRRSRRSLSRKISSELITEESTTETTSGKTVQGKDQLVEEEAAGIGSVSVLFRCYGKRGRLRYLVHKPMVACEKLNVQQINCYLFVTDKFYSNKSIC